MDADDRSTSAAGPSAECGLSPSCGFDGQQDGDLTDMAHLVLSGVARNGISAGWVRKEVAAIRQRHRGDRLALLRTARSLIDAEINRLTAEMAVEA